jgi:hypothetical protein
MAVQLVRKLAHKAHAHDNGEIGPLRDKGVCICVHVYIAVK